MSRLNVFAVAWLILAGCGPQADPVTPGNSVSINTPDIPSEAPHLQGTITLAEEKQILVEENAAEVSGSAKDRLGRTGSTRILRHSGAAARWSDLRVGQRVRVWVIGPVMESYPGQAMAAVIVIEP